MNNRSNIDRGPSQRQLRVAELIRRALSDALIRGDLHDAELSAMSVTVGEVRVTRDLRIATVFALPLGGGDREAMLQLLAKNKGELRHAIDKALSLKFSPELRFQIDHTFDQMDETRALLSRDEVIRDLDEEE